MLFGNKNKRILVELVSTRPNVPVVQLNALVSTLAEEFRPGGNLTLDNSSYTIVEAIPTTRAQAEDIGHLRLVVLSSQPANADDPGVIAPLATFCPFLPPREDGLSKIGKPIFQVNETDWRQVEFVSRSQMAAVDEALGAIQSVIDRLAADIHTSEDVEPYSRVAFTAPLAPEGIPLDELMALFADGREDYEGVAFYGHADLAADAFAFATGSLTQLYGTQSEGIVKSLAIGGIGTYEYDSPELQAIADFCADHDLCLVDWPGALKFEPENEDFFAFFDPPVSDDDEAVIEALV